MEEPLELFFNTGGLEVERGVSLSRLTTWKAGGPARMLVRASELGAAAEALRLAAENGIPFLVLGNGSNTLVSDRGFDGVVMKLDGELAGVEILGEVMRAGAGAQLAAAAARAMRASLSGLEFAAGIPGTVGGAIMTNAGAFSCSVAGVLESVSTMTRGGEPRLHREFVDRYRSPLVPDDEIVTGASFRLEAKPMPEITKMADEMKLKRGSTQPRGEATAGSVFKNPEGASAGRLIDQCGLKGRRLGAARVSERHANFIINEGGATATDIKGLIDIVVEEVRERFGVTLELEVRLVGFEEG